MEKRKDIYKVILNELEKLRKEFARNVNGQSVLPRIKIEEKIIYLCDILIKSKFSHALDFKIDFFHFSELAKKTFPKDIYKRNIIPIIDNILSDF